MTPPTPSPAPKPKTKTASEKAADRERRKTALCKKEGPCVHHGPELLHATSECRDPQLLKRRKKKAEQEPKPQLAITPVPPQATPTAAPYPAMYPTHPAAMYPPMMYTPHMQPMQPMQPYMPYQQPHRVHPDLQASVPHYHRHSCRLMSRR